jgi:5-methylcytosine-specific restriction endonuclease McrA
VNSRYLLVARRARHRCEYCHAPEAAFNFPFEIEHITPTAKSGPDHQANLALGCRACNLYKSDEATGQDPLTKWCDYSILAPINGTIIFP